MRNTMTYRAGKERGFVLIAAMFMLIILTFMAIGLYHNFTMQQNMAGNTKEKGRAFQLAQSSLQYGEYELAANLSGLAVSQSCSSTTAPYALTICQGSVGPNIVYPSASVTAMGMPNGWIYIPTTLADVSILSTGGASTYYANPALFVHYLGLNSTGNGKIYQVTALAYGATSNAVAVVQSTYQVSYSTTNLGTP